MDKQKLGKWGEDLAEKFLISRGIRIIDRNVYTTYGEIDLVCLEGDELIMVEVKTRSTLRFGFPEESVNRKKLEHILLSAEIYLQEHTDLPEKWRVDVIAITGKPESQKQEINWFKNVID